MKKSTLESMESKGITLNTGSSAKNGRGGVAMGSDTISTCVIFEHSVN